MIKSHYVIVSAMMALLTACSGDEDVITPVYSVGEADNAITLRAGIREGGSGVQTRAAEDNHANHLAFTQGTKANLRIDGIWTGHGAGGTVTQKTYATIGAETSSGSKHNSLVLTTDIFWDDYGTADPANTDGRNTGLTIYGVAVDGVTTAPTVGDNWTSLSWTLDADQTSGWAEKDLLTSNNVKSGIDGTLKFDDVKLNNNSASDLLVFTHAMSKVTVKLKAGAGFIDSKFVSTPTVTLLGFYTEGKVNVEGKTTTATTTTSHDISTHLDEGGQGNTTANFSALVFPGNSFANTTQIAKIEADGNVYYVTAEKINAANTADQDVFESGKNYIINVIVNKTEIKVSATVTNWVDVESEEVSPVINVDANWGSSGTGSSDSFDSFSFYRSTSLAEDYSNGLTGNANGYFVSEAIAKKPNASEGTQWKFYNSIANDATEVHLYWPNHNTHYQFRGVWPNTSVGTDDTQAAPHVSKVSESDATQKIDISNAAYSTSQNYPSNLMIGRPEVTGNCNNTETGHTPTDLFSGGICATEGKVNLNFRYVMSQVEVVLSTSADENPDRVNIGNNTKVEILNIATNGYVKLGDRVVVPSATKGIYTLDAVSGSGNELKRHSAIVPQDLTFSTAGASTNVRFKITVTNADSSTDVYYADIKPIKKTGSTDLVAPNGKWESGVHYIYNLKLTKTEIKVTATVTDWTTVYASDDIWM